MNRFLLYITCICFLFCGWNVSAQQWHLRLEGATPIETRTVDSLGYNKKHPNTKSVLTEVQTLEESLQKIGYTDVIFDPPKQISDSLFLSTFRLGKRLKKLHLYIGRENEEILGLTPTLSHTLEIPFESLEQFMENHIKNLERRGYALAQLRLTDHAIIQNVLHAKLWISLGKQRLLQELVFEGYDKFPKGHQKALNRRYRNRIFNQSTLEALANDVNQFGFVQQVKYPEILFSTDTTKVYIYLEKAKANRFDGLIGFTNNETNSKIVFSGYLDVQLTNLMNSGETVQLYWKSDGQQQRTFNASLDLPYLFESPFALKGELQIFKQDSTFQNTKTNLELAYLIRYNWRTSLGYQATESSDIQNVNSAQMHDFKNRFITLGMDYKNLQPDRPLFMERSRIETKFGMGNRDGFQKESQFFGSLDASHQFFINSRNSIHLRTLNYYLKSNNYSNNELLRTGGINSIRGFNENSLQGNILTSILTEYRFEMASNLYAHTLIDYAYMVDDSSNKKNKLLGMGLGIGLLTRTGLLRLIYANGSTDQQSIKLSNSILHLSLNATF